MIGGSDEDLNAAVAIANKADLVILALRGERRRNDGEATSRAHIGLPGRQQELLEKVVATGKPVVLMVFSGRPLTLAWAFQHVPAVLAAGSLESKPDRRWCGLFMANRIPAESLW